MDIARPDVARKKQRRRILYAAAGVLAVVLITTGLSRLKPAAPSVERSTVWVDKVKRGSMLRQVRGLGSLVPEEIRHIPALTEGRVERILVRPGTAVKSDTVLVELSNPEIEQALLDAEFQLKAAEAAARSTEVQRESQVLSQKAEVARAHQEYEEARMRAETDGELAKLGVISELSLKISQGTAEQLKTRDQIEKQRLGQAEKELEAESASQKARVEQLRALYGLARTHKESLKIRAGSDGILQELSFNGQTLQVGQQVPAGTTLAKVADPTRLKAEIRVAETQAKDIQLGLPATVDTRNGTVPGKVARIDPAVINGTVTVDVMLEGELPPGARPDLSVDGTIDLERLEDVLYVGRPAFGQENATVGMFRLGTGGSAERVQVQLGRSSVNAVEIVGGLKEGDEVILSDMSRWDEFERIQLE